jgi:hypothetical protein
VTDPRALVTAAAFEKFLAAERLPAWLPQLLRTLYDGQDPEAADRWGSRIVECCRSASDAGSVESEDERRAPGAGRAESSLLAVAHDWQARTVVPLMAQACQPDGGELAGAAELVRMHASAAQGKRFGEAQWRAALEPALHELYRHAYGYAEAYATAHASASAYAKANNFSPDGAVSFADSYAAMSTGSNRDSFAASNAVANASVLAAAYASDDPQEYAEACPFALARACAQAWANVTDGAEPAAGGQPADRLRLAYARLADGLADSWMARLG